MFAVISTIEIRIRIGIPYKSGYSKKYSFDWWTLNLACIPEVNDFFSYTCLLMLAVKTQVSLLLLLYVRCAFEWLWYLLLFTT